MAPSHLQKACCIETDETVDEYVREFEQLITQARATPEEQLLGYFLAGLYQDVRNQIRPHDPTDLMSAMELARDIEFAMTNIKQQISFCNRNSNSSFRITEGSIVTHMVIVSTANNSQGTNTFGRNFRNNRANANQSVHKPEENSVSIPQFRNTRSMPYQEYVKRREQGLYFQCNLTFGPGHCCPNKTLRVVILAEDESDTEARELATISQETTDNTATPNNQEIDYQWMDLSLFSAGGMTQPQTMKLQGHLQGQVLLLIDNGTSHNFISSKLV